MTKGSATNGNVNASSIDDISQRDRRDQLIKVWVTAAEKAEIARQKARMSFSAFLRERGLNQGHVYDPTYAAIGGVTNPLALCATALLTSRRHASPCRILQQF